MVPRQIMVFVFRLCLLGIILVLPNLDFFWTHPVVSYVSMLVSPSVCNKSSHTSHHQFSLIFCIKLAFSKSKKVTKSDFRKKNVPALNRAKRAQIGPKMRFLSSFLSLLHQILLIFHIQIDQTNIYNFCIDTMAEKKCPELLEAILGPKFGPGTDFFFKNRLFFKKNFFSIFFDLS